MSLRVNDLVGVVAALALCASTAAGSVLYVDDDASLGGDGRSWATAYRFLQDALADAAASGGDVTEIRVGQGLYRPDRDRTNPVGSGDPLATFQLIDGVWLAGGYAGVGAPMPDQRDVSNYVTTLHGDLLGDDGPGFVNNGDNSCHVVTGSLNDATAILDGFTITAGNASGPDATPDPPYDGSGAGLFVVAGSPTVRDCRFELNFAVGAGAGMVVNDGGSPSIHGSTFVGNVAGVAGGALRCGHADITITDSTFLANQAHDVLRGGGAIASFESKVLVRGSVFEANHTAGEGGVIASVSGESIFLNSTLVRNTATGPGGGLCAMGGSTTEVFNSILYWNDGSDSEPLAEQIYNIGVQTVTRVRSSNTQGGLGSSGTIDDGGNIDALPAFVQAQSSPGLDGMWGTHDDDLADLRLAAGSACIDAGDNALVSFGLNTDLDGHVRFFDDPTTVDTGVAGALGGDAVVDLGPFEHGAPPSGEWTDLGTALGSPALAGSGALLDDEPTTLLLVDAPPGAQAFLVLGLSELNATFKQGVLVPSPDLVVALPVDGAGSIGLSFAWFAGLPSGTAVTYQYWIQDAAGPAGFSASNGLRSKTP